MSIQLFSCLLLCCGFVSLEAAQVKQPKKRKIDSLDQFKIAVGEKFNKQPHVTFINSSQSSPVADRADHPQDKQSK